MRLIRGQTSISVPKNNFRFSGKPRQPTSRQDQNRPHVQFPQSAHTESKELAPTFLRRKVAMEHYEVRDAMRRAIDPALVLEFELFLGDAAYKNVQFTKFQDVSDPIVLGAFLKNN